MVEYEFPTVEIAAGAIVESAIWQKSEEELNAAYGVLLRAGVPTSLIMDLGDAAHDAVRAGKRLIHVRFQDAAGEPVPDVRRAKLTQEADEAAAKMESVYRAVVASAKAHVAPEPHTAAD